MAFDFENPNEAGNVANVALYRLCQDWPQHDDPDLVEHKIGIIAKYYDVSRNLGGAYKAIATAMCDYKLDLDRRLEGLRSTAPEERWSEAVALHELVDERICKEIQPPLPDRTGKRLGGLKAVTSRASFVSKYLHFHVPEAFPILDSYAEAGVKHFVEPVRFAGTVKRYARFCHKIERLKAMPEFCLMSLREIDTLLVDKGRAMPKTEAPRRLGAYLRVDP